MYMPEISNLMNDSNSCLIFNDSSTNQVDGVGETGYGCNSSNIIETVHGM